MLEAQYIELLQAIERHLASFGDTRWPKRLSDWRDEFTTAQFDAAARVHHLARTRRALGGMGSIADVVIAPEAGHRIADDERVIKAANDKLLDLAQQLDKVVGRLLSKEPPAKS